MNVAMESQVCNPCLKLCVNKDCPLPCSAPCAHMPARPQDLNRCRKRLACGHQCCSIAGFPCPAQELCLECAREGTPESRDTNKAHASLEQAICIHKTLVLMLSPGLMIVSGLFDLKFVHYIMKCQPSCIIQLALGEL